MKNTFFIVASIFLLFACKKDKEIVCSNCANFSVEATSWVNNYTAQAIVSGGQEPYVYSWSNGSSQKTIGNANGSLSSGTYWVTVSDKNGCVASDSIVIPKWPVVVIIE